MAIEIASGHDPVIGGDDFDLRLSRCGVDEHSIEPTGGSALGELSPFIAPSRVRMFHVQFISLSLCAP